MGVGELFGPGTNTQDIIKYIKNWSEKRSETTAK